MSDAAAAPAALAKAAKRKSGSAKPKKQANHPKYAKMISDAITALKERGGSSRQAILKYIVKHYSVGHDERTINAHLKMALRAGVKNGSLKQSKGTGASGSFRVGDKAEPKVKKAKAPRAKKPKATKKPKAAGAKKTAAKKPKKATVKKPKAAATKKPKVAKKPKAAAAKPKKAKAAKPKKAAAKPKKAAPKKK